MGEPPALVDHPEPGVCRVRMNRPERLNAINPALLEHLRDVLVGSADNVIVLGTTNGRAFSSGGDLSLGTELNAVSDALYDLCEKMICGPPIIVAAVEGHAIGGGVQFALASGIRVGGPTTQFQFVGSRLGAPVGVWALNGWAGRVNPLDLCLTGRRLIGAEAHAVGILDRYTENVAEEAVSLASELAKLDAGDIAMVKSLIVRDTGVTHRLRQERKANSEKPS